MPSARTRPRGAAVLAVAAVLAGTAGCGFLQDRASGTQRVDGYVVLDRAVTAATPDDRDAVRRRPGGDVRAAGLTPVSR